MWAHWRQLANMIELVLPSAHPSPKIGKSIGSAISAKSPYTLQWATLSPKLSLPQKIVPCHGDLERLITHQNGISIGSAIFTGLTSVTDRQTTLLCR